MSLSPPPSAPVPGGSVSGGAETAAPDLELLRALDALTFQDAGLHWLPAAQGRRSGLQVPLPGLSLPTDAWGGVPAPDWAPLRREDGRLVLRLRLPRWQRFARPYAGSLAWQARTGDQGEMVSLIALAARLRADLEPLTPPTERAGLHELLAAQGWDDALRREQALDASADEEGRSLFPEPIDHAPQARLGGALMLLRSLDGRTITLLTPCGEALRRSLAEEAGLVAAPSGKRVPRRWTHDAPVPELHLQLDTAQGLAALPWRLHWGAKDAVLHRHGWRSTWDGDWDGRADQRDALELNFFPQRVPGAPLRAELRHEGRLYFAQLHERGEATLI